jgi:hypothetical protein
MASSIVEIAPGVKVYKIAVSALLTNRDEAKKQR